MCDLARDKTAQTIAPVWLPQAVVAEEPVEGEDMPLEVPTPVENPEEVPVP